jgi:hypothetical protein
MVAVPTHPRDHKAWLAYWAEQLERAIADAVAHPDPVGEDFRMNYVVHCARIAYGRATKVRPSLRIPRDGEGLPRHADGRIRNVRRCSIRSGRPRRQGRQGSETTMKSKHSAAAGSNKKKKGTPKEKSGPAAQAEVVSPQSPATTPVTAATEPQEKKQMTLNLKSLDKRGRNAIYHGAAVSLRLSTSAFPNKTAPATIEVADGVFAVKTERQPRKRLTKEERAALPKPTLAERLAKAEKRAAALRAKAEKEGAAAQM